MELPPCCVKEPNRVTFPRSFNETTASHTHAHPGRHVYEFYPDDVDSIVFIAQGFDKFTFAVHSQNLNHTLRDIILVLRVQRVKVGIGKLKRIHTEILFCCECSKSNQVLAPKVQLPTGFH